MTELVMTVSAGQLKKSRNINQTGTFSITVPDGHIYHIKQVMVKFTASATVGTRYVRMRITDGISTIWESLGVQPTAGQTASLYLGQKLKDTTVRRLDGPVNVSLTDQLDDLWVRPDWQLQIFDANGVDTSNDRFNVYIIYEDYTFT